MEQGTEEWFAARAGKVTASKISDVLMKPTTAGFQNYLAQLVCERLTGKVAETFTSAAMQHGTDTEPQARAFYELVSGVSIDEVGFIDHPSIEWTGASPDGLIGDDGLIEIKCPQQPKHINNLLGGKIDRGYSLQMQWQMACTGRVWCDFVSFNPTFPDEMQLHIQRVHRDSAGIVEIETAVSAFLAEIETAKAELTKKYSQEGKAA